MSSKELFFGGPIITLNDANPSVEAVGIENEKIVAVGTLEEVKNILGKNYKIHELNGNTLLPGFIDCHLHPISFLFFLLNPDLSQIKSLKELKQLLKEASKDKPKDQLVLGLSLKEEEFLNPEERVLPTKWDLDEACPENPVFILRYDGHSGVANSKALDLAGIGKDTIAPEGGEIRKNADGEVTGILTELATNLLLSKVSIPDFKTINEVAKKAFEILAGFGLTSLQAVVQAEAGAEMGDAGALELPILKTIKNIIPQNWYSLIYVKHPKKLKRLKKPPLDDLQGDSKFKVGGLKIYADGTYGSATACMFEPFTDQPDKIGFMTISEEDLYNYMVITHNLGFQIFIHTIGDKGNRIVVDTYKKLLKEYPRENHRHRIEHASQLNPDVIKDMSELGIIASCQPPFLNSEYTWLKKRLGEDRIKHSYPYKSLIDAGVVVASGSDCPIESADVIQGLHALVTRNGFVPEQCISIEDALKTYTINAAYASFEEDIKGSIEVEKLADMVILDKNPLEIPIEEIKNIKVKETII